jgi:hypothetical protein
MLNKVERDVAVIKNTINTVHTALALPPLLPNKLLWLRGVVKRSYHRLRDPSIVDQLRTHIKRTSGLSQHTNIFYTLLTATHFKSVGLGYIHNRSQPFILS